MFKASDIDRFLAGLAIVAVIAGVVMLRVAGHAPRKAGGPPPPPGREACGAPSFAAAARANGQSLQSLVWAPFGPSEVGWSLYAPLIAREAATACAADTPGFAAAYARWQAAHYLPVDGVVKAADFTVLRNELELRRPFVQLTAKGICPPPPAPEALATARPDEAYGAKPVELRIGALNAYRGLVALARAQGLGRGDMLKLVSGYRGPDEEAARCADGGCNRLTRAHCSAHRTGLAMDLYLGHAAGEDPTSTDPANRAALMRSPAYLWLVKNAGRYGFLPYPYEPWHWEWTGAPP